MDQHEDCDCCQGLDAETPRIRSNPPGLSAIQYRVGRHADFRASLLARLSSTDFPALARLTSRDDDDFTIALCDAAATVFDVLSFYQERIANENYLRTAVERGSILALAQLIGYRPAPGVAASSWLAFSVQESPGMPAQTAVQTRIPASTRVQSIPGPNEQPSTFETSEEIEARASWNALRAQTEIPWIPQRDDTALTLTGVANAIAPGDALLIVGQERVDDPGSERWDVRIVSRVEPDIAHGITRVSWLEGLGSHLPSVLPAQAAPRAFVLRQRASLFGHNAPDPRLMSVKDTNLGPLTTGSGKDFWWVDYQISPPDIDLDAAYPKVVAQSWVALVSNQANIGTPSLPGYVELFRAQAVSVVSQAKFGLSGRTTRLRLDSTEHLTADRFKIANTLVLAQSEELPVAARPLDYPVYGAEIRLAPAQTGLQPKRALALSGKAPRVRLAPGAKGLALRRDDGSQLPLAPGDSLQLMLAPCALVAGSPVVLTPEQFADALRKTGTLRLRLRDRSGQQGTLDAQGTLLRLEPPRESDDSASEVALVAGAIDAVKADREGTRVALQASTRHVYDRRSLRVNANVVAATCGESVDEIVGSGAADQPDQRFALRQGPLTYVSAQTPDGRASTLTLRVNDLAWQEVPHLYQRGPNERVFTTQADDSGRTTVVFGDGIEGARPPSGRDNIRAHYRKGLGTSGNVKTGQLANLLNRPLGVAGVSNPEAASGGQDAELTDAARDSAPLTVLTLERAVSVLDYQNFSRSFAGIAKAHAVWIAAGAGRGVFITVAAEQGAALDENDATYVDLLGALRRYGDALLNLRVASYRPALFGLRVALKLAGDADRAVVLAGAERALRDAFSFEKRSFGQIVSIDEVAAILHADPSVVAVNVIELYRTDQGAPPLAPRLFARLPETSLTALPEPAELLALDASRLTLEIMQ